jgi:hypothetical protein
MDVDVPLKLLTMGICNRRNYANGRVLHHAPCSDLREKQIFVGAVSSTHTFWHVSFHAGSGVPTVMIVKSSLVEHNFTEIY